MIQVPQDAKLYVVPFYIDEERDFDDYIAACKRHKLDVISGDIFVFRNEDSYKIGILSYDGSGYQWCVKRFSSGGVAWWPEGNAVTQISSGDLQALLQGENPRSGES